MTDAQLAFYSSWASILGLAVSIASLLYVRSIKSNIIRFRRKQRRQQLIREVLRIGKKEVPLQLPSKIKLLALKRNIPIYAWSRFTAQGKVRIEVHKLIDEKNIIALREALRDLSSFSEDV